MKKKPENTAPESSFIQELGKLIGGSKIVDLTHSLETSMPAWPSQARFGSVVYESYDFGGVALHSLVTMSEHTGTHIDAPKHFIKGGIPLDRVALKKMMGRGVCIDVPAIPGAIPSKETAGRLLGLDAIKTFEKKHGEIKKGDIVMFRFGWDKKYKLQPHAAEYLKNWPGLSKEAAQYLVKKEIAVAGTDAISIDAYGTEDYIAHYELLGKGILIIENIVNLDTIPVFSYVIGLPNKFKGGSGSPLRLIAFVQ